MSLIIIKKNVGMTQWEYPGKPELFTNQFNNPDGSEELIAENGSGLTLTKLSENVSYIVKSYTGEVPNEVEIERLVLSKDVLQGFPLGTLRQLRNIKNSSDYNDSVQAKDGDTADLLLEIISTGDPINVASKAFVGLTDWMVANDNLEVKKEDIDKIKKFK